MNSQRSQYVTATVVAAGLGTLCVVVHIGFGRVSDSVAAAAQACKGPVTAPSSFSLATPPSAPSDPALLARDRELRINEQAREVFLRQHQQYVSACWHPKPPSRGSPPDFGAQFEVTVSFDASGVEVGREIKGGNPPRPDLLDCARNLRVPPLTIPAPGAPTTTSLQLPIP